MMNNVEYTQHDQPTSRRRFVKETIDLTTSVLASNLFPSQTWAEGRDQYDLREDVYYGSRYGVIEHHRPSDDLSGEKFIFVRLQYPGGDWYTNIINYYRWPSDLKFSQVLSNNTSINVGNYQNPQYVSIDDDDIFVYPYIFMTGHRGIRLSKTQTNRLREYIERGGFIHAEDCDIRLNGGRGFMRPSVHRLMEQLFPGKKLEQLDLSHPIYHTLYDHDEYLGGDKVTYPYATYDEALMIDGRIAVYFSSTDYNCAWEGRPCSPGGEEQRRWAFEQGMNIVAYALSR